MRPGNTLSGLFIIYLFFFFLNLCLLRTYLVASLTELLDLDPEEEEGGTVIARKVGEAVQSTLGAVVTAIDIPLGV